MSVFEDMAYLLPQRLSAICASSMRRLSGPFTPVFPARHLPALSSAAVRDSAAPRLQNWAPSTHLAQAPECCTPAKLLQKYFISSTHWKVSMSMLVWTKWIFLIRNTARSYRMSSPWADLFKYSHKVGSPLSCPLPHCTHEVAGFRRPLMQHSTFPFYSLR